MNNTKRSLIFGISLIISTFIYTLLMVCIPSTSAKTLFYISLYMIMPVIFFIVRKIYISRYFDESQLFFALNGKLKTFNLRVLLYAILLFTEYRIYASFSYPQMYLTILFWIAVSETFIFISNRTVKVYFMRNAVIVKGNDFRIDVPLGDGLQSVSGIYSYDDFEEYSLKKETLLTLFLDKKRGTLSMILPKETAPNIIAFLQSKHIKLIKS